MGNPRSFKSTKSRNPESGLGKNCNGVGRLEPRKERAGGALKTRVTLSFSDLRAQMCELVFLDYQYRHAV